jgi:hypothetical protein
VFILPQSPLPPLVDQGGQAVANEPKTATLLSPTVRRALVCLLALGAAGLLLWGLAVRPVWFGRESPPVRVDDLDEIRVHISQGQQSWREGNFQSAVEEFRVARRIETDLSGKPEFSQLDQLLRQAELLADLLAESLEEVSHQMEGLGEREAQSVFVRRFKGKAVVFYSGVRQDANGKYYMDYRLVNGAWESSADLGNLVLFKQLPLREPTTVLFGARLEQMRRQANGSWLIGFQPDSAVLLTDLDAATGCCFGVANDDELRAVVARQAEWTMH